MITEYDMDENSSSASFLLCGRVKIQDLGKKVNQREERNNNKCFPVIRIHGSGGGCVTL